MNPLKQLLGQTAIYGIGSILGRLVNFILPLVLSRGILDTVELGIHSNLYAYVGFFVVFYSFGMETTFFRYATKDENAEQKTLSTSFIFLAVLATIATLTIILFNESIASFLEIEGSENFIIYLAIVLGVDALTVIPFAYLRLKKKAEKFASIRLSNILMNVILTFFFIGPVIGDTSDLMIYKMFDYTYDPEFNIGYLLIANLIASIFTLLLLSPVLIKIRLLIDKELLLKMIKFAYPLVIVAMAGQINNLLDKMLIPKLIEGTKEYRLGQVGIYNINYKLAMSMSLAIQAFQMAAEPFFFSQAKDKKSPKLFATIMKYFTLFCWLIFLSETLFLPQLKYVIGEEFREGIEIVPIILLGLLSLGVYYNLSIWYKLTDKTHYGSYIASIGAVITILGNIITIPYFGYHGAAWTTLICYLTMATISYFWGKKHFPIPYNMRKIFFYSGLALCFYFLSWIPEDESLTQIIVSSALLLTYISIVVIIENPRKLLS